jgi:hypothetical protein
MGWGVKGGRRGEEMTQILYAHMNKRKKNNTSSQVETNIEKIRQQATWLQQTWEHHRPKGQSDRLAFYGSTT